IYPFKNPAFAGCYVLNYKSIGENRTFFGYNNTIFNGIELGIGVFEMWAAIQPYIVPYPTVFINDTVADITSFTNAYRRYATRLFVSNIVDGFVEIATHHIAAYHCRTVANARAYSNHTVFNTRSIDDTSFGNNGFFQCCTTDFSRR